MKSSTASLLLSGTALTEQLAPHWKRRCSVTLCRAEAPRLERLERRSWKEAPRPGTLAAAPPGRRDLWREAGGFRLHGWAMCVFIIVWLYLNLRVCSYGCLCIGLNLFVICLSLNQCLWLSLYIYQFMYIYVCIYMIPSISVWLYLSSISIYTFIYQPTRVYIYLHLPLPLFAQVCVHKFWCAYTNISLLQSVSVYFLTPTHKRRPKKGRIYFSLAHQRKKIIKWLTLLLLVHLGYGGRELL